MIVLIILNLVVSDLNVYYPPEVSSMKYLVLGVFRLEYFYFVGKVQGRSAVTLRAIGKRNYAYRMAEYVK